MTDFSSLQGDDTMDYPVFGIFVVPVSAGKSRVIFQGINSKFIPTWLGHAGSNRFLNTDTWLHDAELAAREQSVVKENYVYGSRSDFAPTLFRKWWREFGYSKTVCVYS